MLRVGLCGLGFMGRGHFDRYQQIEGVQVTAIADVEPERRQGELQVQGNIDLGLKKLDMMGIATYPTAEALIAQADVDIVDICLPTYLHSRYSVAALQAGKHVMCEKPMALNVAEADAMVQAAQRAGKVLMVGQCIRFWTEYLYLKRLVDTREFGGLLSLRLSRLGTAPQWSWQGWMVDAPRSGGAVLDLHVHDVDFVHYLLGKPQAIWAQGGKAGATTGYDFVNAAYQYPQVPRVTVEGGWMRGGLGFQASYDAWFEGGFLRYRGWETPTLTLYPNDQAESVHPECEPGDAYTQELRYFVDCVATGQRPERCLPESARDSLGLLFAELESFQKGAPVLIGG